MNCALPRKAVPTPGTLFENENERQKTELVSLPLPRAAGSCYEAKKKEKNFFANLDFQDNSIYPF